MTDEITLKRGNEEVVLTENRIRELTSKFMEMMATEAAIHDDFGMSIKVLDTLVRVKQVWYPSTQKNLNVNVEAFDDKLAKWMTTRKELKEAQKEKAEDIVVEIV